MSALILDTSIWIDYFNEGLHATGIEVALREGRVHLPPIVLAELLSGDLTSKRRSQLESLLTDLALCKAGFQHWCDVGSLRGTLRRKGILISTPDAHIVQCALELDAELASNDKVFQRVAKAIKLKIVNI